MTAWRTFAVPEAARGEAIHRVHEAEEQRLLEACRRGEPAALRQLVETHYDPLYRFLWRLTASSEAAAELAQEAFVRALERLHAFKGRSRFSTWLHAIALNLWKDARRRPTWESGSLPEHAPGSTGPGGEQEALARLERHEVRRAVERLPEAQRVAILLFYYEGKSHREIAQICGCPIGTVGTRIYHGLRALRRMLGEPDCARAPLIERSRCP